MKTIFFVQGINSPDERKVELKAFCESKGYSFVTVDCKYKWWQTDKIVDFKRQIEEKVSFLPEGEKILIAHSFGGIVTTSLPDSCLRQFQKLVFVASAHKYKKVLIDKVKKAIGIRENIFENKELASKIYSFAFAFDHLVPFMFAKLSERHRILLHHSHHQ
jgi:predicted alpha/beta hydrolase family esterase